MRTGKREKREKEKGKEKREKEKGKEKREKEKGKEKKGKEKGKEKREKLLSDNNCICPFVLFFIEIGYKSFSRKHHTCD